MVESHPCFLQCRPPHIRICWFTILRHFQKCAGAGNFHLVIISLKNDIHNLIGCLPLDWIYCPLNIYCSFRIKCRYGIILYATLLLLYATGSDYNFHNPTTTADCPHTQSTFGRCNFNSPTGLLHNRYNVCRQFIHYSKYAVI